MPALPVRAAWSTCILMLLVLMPAASAHAQGSGRIRGTITDATTRGPIADAQIAVVNTTLGGASVSNGTYVIDNVPPGTHRLRVRRIGYAVVDTTVTVEREAVVDFALRQSAALLSQVVVTGTPQATERRTLGNSITSIDAADINQKSTNLTVTDLLQSKAPGVTVMPGSGAPGTSGEIRIRGASSLSGYRPVIYIDGIRYNDASLGNFNPTGSGLAGQAQSAQATSALDFVNANDIESIEVLKGPAAAALYGADAAGGVIQIITKKGTRGQQKMRWTTRAEMGSTDWHVATPINYITCDAARKADTVTWPGCKTLPLNTVLTNNPLRDDPAALRDGDLLRLSVSTRGGGDRYSYYVSGDRDNDEGVFHNSWLKRKSLRANFTFSPEDRLDFGFNFGFQQSHVRLPYQDESANALLLSASRGRPGRVSGDRWATIAPSRSNEYNNQSKADRYTFGGTVNFRPFSWFQNRFTAGWDQTNNLAQLLSEPGSVESVEGFIAQRFPRARLYTMDYAGSITLPLPKEIVTTTSFGSQIVSRRDENLSATGTGLGAEDVVLIGTATTTSGTNAFSEQNSVGLYVQEQVAWRNRIFVTGALRADDNSSFGENFDVIVYPKLSVSWVLSDEPALRRWLQSARAEELKFRAAWGRAGRAPSPYSAVQTYTIDKTTLSTASVPILRTSAFGNPDLKPEQGEEYEVGFDGGFFSGRAGVDFTYYHKRTTDMLLSTPTPPSMGFATSQLQNLGQVTNSGIEVALFGTPIEMERFSWETRITLATNSNRLDDFGIEGKTSETPTGQPYGVTQQHREGYPLGGYWVRLPLRDPATGAPLMSGTSVRLDTATYVGPSVPTREVGFSNTFTLFKNFRLYALVDYKGGHKLFNAKESNRCISNDNCARVNDPRVRNPQTAADSLLARELPVYRQVSGIYVEDAAFIKLRDLSVSYTVPSAWAARARLESAVITLSGKNLALWTDYSGLDPEVNSYGGRLFSRADVYASPQTRRLSMAVTVTY